MHSKKYYIIYGLFFSLFVAAVLCLCLTIVQGMPHIDPVFFLMSFLVAFITSFVVTAVIPLARIAAACAQYYDAKPGSVAFRLIQNVFFSTLIMFFLGIVMTAFMTGIGAVAGGIDAYWRDDGNQPVRSLRVAVPAVLARDRHRGFSLRSGGRRFGGCHHR